MTPKVGRSRELITGLWIGYPSRTDIRHINWLNRSCQIGWSKSCLGIFGTYMSLFFLWRQNFSRKKQTYPVFIAKVSKGLGFLTEADDANLLFLRFDDIFRMFHMLPLHLSMVCLVALKLAHQIKMEDTPDIVIVDPYYMQEMFLNNPQGRKEATCYLRNLFLKNVPNP